MGVDKTWTPILDPLLEPILDRLLMMKENKMVGVYDA